MKRLFALSLLALFGAGFLAGCNTVHGAGQDIEEGGEAVQDASN